MKKLTIAVTLAVLLVASGCDSSDTDTSEAEGWASDINWIADSLPGLHYNLFMYNSEENLRSSLDELEADLSNLSNWEIVMRLTEILASMNCSHTGIAFWELEELTVYPITVMWLEDGLFVTGIDAEHTELIGSELVGYGESTALEAASAMAEMFPAINEISVKVRAENFMMLAEPMQALGFGNSDTPVNFTFVEESGDTTSVQLSAVNRSQLNMSDFHFVDSVTLPLFLESDDNYWFRFIPERNMLYCAYNSCVPMSDYPLETFVFELNQAVETQQINSIVIDLRRNMGGNSMLATPLVSWLERQSANGTSVSLITGRWTFSSGILNSVEISEIPGVRVYGENTSGSPNHLGEVRTALLPWSGLPVSYPTKYFQMVDGEGSTMVPDVQIPLTAEMLFHGQNSILDAIYSDCVNPGQL
ncbi:MAG: hypothetical protein J7K88_00880 [Candidatus Fermentibacteraceae bacterium]|nr:hypothetical protein [Candidatus Fermentibacteraceae bacterium]